MVIATDIEQIHPILEMYRLNVGLNQMLAAVAIFGGSLLNRNSFL